MATHALEPRSLSGALSVPDLTDEAVQTLVDVINRDGFGFIADYVGADELEQMRTFVRQAVRVAGGEYIGFKGKEAVAGSTLDDFGESPVFQDLFRRIYQKGTGRAPPPVEFYQILRCLAGRGSQAHSLIFHYDSYVLTALIPVEIPAEQAMAGATAMPTDMATGAATEDVGAPSDAASGAAE